MHKVLDKSHLVSELLIRNERFESCSSVIVAANFANVDFYVYLVSDVTKLLSLYQCLFSLLLFSLPRSLLRCLDQLFLFHFSCFHCSLLALSCAGCYIVDCLYTTPTLIVCFPSHVCSSVCITAYCKFIVSFSLYMFSFCH